MAPVELQLTKEIDPKNFDIVSFASESSWKDVLISLINQNKLDPWDIDLSILVEKYVETIRSMKVMDLRIPANIILAAATLLRMKSDMLKYEDSYAGSIEEADEMIERPVLESGQLVLRTRVPPRRRITLNELLSALEEAISIKSANETKAVKMPIDFPIHINPVDIEATLENVYSCIAAAAGTSGKATLTEVLRSGKFEDVLLGLFIPMLYLEHKKRISTMQETFFGEVIIFVS